MMKRTRKGQTMVEYIIIVGLIAIALIGIVSFFGETLFKKFKGAGEELSTQKSSETYNTEKIKSLGED